VVATSCWHGICFLPLDNAGPRFFGFSEFLVALAIMVLAWTTADVRYQFRLYTAPIRMRLVALLTMACIGLMALATDLWRAEGWLVPVGTLITPAEWQALLAFGFLLTFFLWTWVAFFKPPTFGPGNALVYGRALYKFILRGVPTELAVVADEFTHSARSLIFYASPPIERPDILVVDKTRRNDDNTTTIDVIAKQILSLIGNRGFCRAVVASSPQTAEALFEELAKTKAAGALIRAFGRNVVLEALQNKDSFMYSEATGYESGLIGYHKPLSKAIFGNWQLVESVGTLFDPTLRSRRDFTPRQWEAYGRMVNITFQDFAERALNQTSYALNRALNALCEAVGDLYKIDGQKAGAWNSDESGRLMAAMHVIQEAIREIDTRAIASFIVRRHRKDRGQQDIYDVLAKCSFKLICAASKVRTPSDLCWSIQYVSVWSDLFATPANEGRGGRLFRFKLRRLIYNEVVELRRFPGYVGGPLLGFCLNVMGLTLEKRKRDMFSREAYALKRVVLAWTKRNYLWLRSESPKLAARSLVESITFDEVNVRLTKTYFSFSEKDGPSVEHLKLDPWPLSPDGTSPT